MPSPKQVPLLKIQLGKVVMSIGPGKAVISISNHNQIINLLKRRVFQLICTLKVKSLTFWQQIWNQLKKLFLKMILILKIGCGKADISVNIYNQIINLLKRKVFQLLCIPKVENLEFGPQIWHQLKKVSKNGPTFENWI